jgi:hypothetical protein
VETRGEVGYRAAHKRVQSERGPAWLGDCADCGEGADEWSYDHNDLHELEATDNANLGALYSLDAARYSPRCKACHVRFDLARAAERRGEAVRVPDGWLQFLPVAGWQLRQMYRQSRGLPDDPVSDLRDLLGMFITAQDASDLDMVALWIAGTHLVAQGVGNAFPRLAIVAPSYGAGKSTLLDVIARTGHRGELVTSSITDALIPRLLQSEGSVTLCLDEADKTLRPENAGAVAVLNAGWQRGATARINQPTDGGGWAPAKIDVFAPIALAGNGVRLAADTRERTLTARLVRADGAPEMRWADELSGADDQLRRRLEQWAKEAAKDSRVRRPTIPEGLRGRDRDRWSVLISAARGVGGSWVRVAERLAIADRDRRAAEAAAAGVAPNEQLAYDLFAVWRDGDEWTATAALVDRLAVINPELWGVPSGRPLSAKSLGWKLREYYGLVPGRFGVGADRQRGFCAAEVRKAWQAVGLIGDSSRTESSG